MPRPLPPGGVRRRAVPLRLSAEEEAPVQAIADAEHDGNLSAAIRALLTEAVDARTRDSGRCAESSPTLGIGTPTTCELRSGHAGWHRSGEGTEWGTPTCS